MNTGSSKKYQVYNEMMGIENYYTIIKLSEGIFHDFKNILAMISGLAQLSMQLNDPEEINKNLKKITESALNGRNSIDVFGLFIKGQLDREMKAKNFKKIMLSTLDMIQYKLIPNSKATIDLELNLFSNAIINCYEYGLRQSLLNLLLNAIESMEDKGGILKVNTFDSYETLVIEIIDSGNGIPEDVIDKIFEPYFTTKGDRGTGLGMKVVKDTLDFHGATIDIESKVGEGSKITILFPIVGCEE